MWLAASSLGWPYVVRTVAPYVDVATCVADGYVCSDSYVADDGVETCAVAFLTADEVYVDVGVGVME